MKPSDPFDLRSPFESLERARRERLVKALSRGTVPALVPIVIFFALILLSSPSWQIFVVFCITTIMIPGAWVANGLTNRGESSRASYLLLFGYLAMVSVNASLIEGLFLVAAFCFLIVVVMGGMLLDARGSYIIAGIAAALWLGIWLVDTAGLLAPISTSLEFISTGVVIITLIGIFFGAFMSQLATRDLRVALDDATYNLVQANRQLEAASKLKSQFTARTSHELRTPLSSIIVSTDLVLRKGYGPLTRKQEENLQRALHGARRLKVLIDDLLDLSKLEAGEVAIYEVPFNLNDMIDTVRSSVQAAAEERKLKLAFTVASDMPARIMGDESRLCQVLINLVDNAVKYTDKGEVSVFVGPLGSDQWQMVVKDTGRGIQETDYENIFQAFRQLDSTRTFTATKGVGLGLAITRHLIQLMGGAIRVDSELGKGSTFTVNLPLKPLTKSSEDRALFDGNGE